MSITHPDFTILRELGRGGSATVYLAVQLSLNRRVALKVLHNASLLQANQGDRFLREARIVAKLAHPHIVPVYDVVRWEDNVYFMTMEFLPGGTLKSRFSTITLRELVRSVGQVCEALSFMHQQDFVHRDIKPDNVLFRTETHAVLSDFGVARAASSTTQMTVQGALMGTPDYMSPEQIRGEEVSAASDLYGLGVLIFEALSGYRPFGGDTAVATSMQHLSAKPRQLPARLKAFQTMIDGLLEKQPNKRTDDASVAADQLVSAMHKCGFDPDTPILELHSTDAPPKVVMPVARRSPSRRRLAFGTAGLVLVVGAGVGGWVFQSMSLTETAPKDAAQEAPAVDVVPITALERTLKAAEEAYLTQRWFDPPETAALNLYREALAMSPEHEQAGARIEQMFGVVHGRVQLALSVDRLEVARDHYAQLAASWPGDARLQPLAMKIEDAAAERRRGRELADRDRRVAELLASAPTHPNPAERYRAVLQLEPGNAVAASALDTLRQRYVLSIERLIAQGNEMAAREELSRFQNAMPLAQEHAGLTASLALAEAQSSRIDAAIADTLSWLDDPTAEKAVGEALITDLRTLLEMRPGNVRLADSERRIEDRLAALRAQGIAEASARGDQSEEDAEDENQFQGITSF